MKRIDPPVPLSPLSPQPFVCRPRRREPIGAAWVVLGLLLGVVVMGYGIVPKLNELRARTDALPLLHAAGADVHSHDTSAPVRFRLPVREAQR